VLVCRHERDGVHEHIVLTGAHGQRVEVELTDSGVRAKEVMPAKGAAGNHDGLAGYDKAGLGHAREEEQEPRQLARL
jgi:hypothetical protein